MAHVTVTLEKKNHIGINRNQNRNDYRNQNQGYISELKFASFDVS